MPYDTNNLNTDSPRLGSGEGGANAGYTSAKWVYREDGGDNLATITANDYITDGNDKGVQVGDIIDFVEGGVAAERRLVTVISATGGVTSVPFS